MTRRVLAALALMTVGSVAALRAHEVPDRVRIDTFVKAEPTQLRVLVRMPANALIDYVFPTMDVGNWLDLPNAEAMAAEGARVWIADLLTFSQDGVTLPTPDLVAVRLSRVNDPAFRSFDDAVARIHGGPIPAGALVLQDQVTVDAELVVPVTAKGGLTFHPRFSRLGVVVDTSLTYLTPSGETRAFLYQGDPPAFALDARPGEAFRRFTVDGARDAWSDRDSLVLTVVVALAVAARAVPPPFLGWFIAAQIALAGLMPAALLFSAGVRGLVGLLVAAITVYLGTEVIVERGGSGRTLALLGGACSGVAAALRLHPLVQFGGTHAAASIGGFVVGAIAIEALALLVCLGLALAVRRVARDPRMTFIVLAAIAIHVAWRTMLERADALRLVPIDMQAPTDTLLMAAGAAALTMLVMRASWPRRRRQAPAFSS